MADWALCIIAGISLLLSFYSVIANIKLEKEQKRLDDLSLKICMEQLKIAQGQIELEMANQLSSAKRYVDGFDTMCFEYLEADKKRDTVKKKRDFVLEEALNCYEQICQKYLDGKGDTERFKKTYYREIHNLFSKNSIFKDKLDGDSSPFKAIKKVYNKWDNFEQ